MTAFADDETFYLVTDASAIQDSSIVVIVSKTYSRTLSTGQSSGSSISSTSVNNSFGGDSILVPDDAMKFTIIKYTSTNWYFQPLNSSQYLGTTSKGTDVLTLIDEKNSYSKAKIKIDSSNGYEATISFGQDKKAKIGYNYSSNDGIFKYYHSTCPPTGTVYLYYSPPRKTLDGGSQTATNGSMIESLTESKKYNLTVKRTFVGDGGWYTLCLPFALTANDIATTFKQAEFYEYTSVAMSELDYPSLNFTKVEQTEAGKPYLMKMVDGVTVTNPLFINKTITATTPQSVSHTLTDNGCEYSFVGIYDPTSLDNKPSAYFVSAKGTSFVRSNNNGKKLNGLRAYFLMPAASSNAKLNVNDPFTSISIPQKNKKATDGMIFTIDGRRVDVSKDCLPRGFYIIGGKKTIVK